MLEELGWPIYFRKHEVRLPMKRKGDELRDLGRRKTVWPAWKIGEYRRTEVYTRKRSHR